MVRNSIPMSARLAVLVLVAGCGATASFPRIEARLAEGDVGGALRRYAQLAKRHRPDRLAALQRIAQTVLVAAGRDRSRAVRDHAFVTLALLGEDALPLLRQLVASSEPTRSRALSGLVRAGDEDSAEELKGALRSPLPEARSAAISWLRIKERWRRIERMLLDVDAAVRRSALDALLSAPPSSSRRQVLRDVLQRDPARAVRAAAAPALARYGDDAVEPLSDSLARESAISVQVSCVAALGRIGSGRARAQLRRFASGEPTAPGVEAARLLGAGDADAIAYLRRAMANGPEEMRLQAIVAAGQFAPLRDSLRERLTGPSTGVRLRAAAALARNSPADRALALLVLQELLGAEPAVALQAAIVFGELHDRRGMNVATAALVAPSAALRSIAAHAVGESLGAPERVQSLLLDQDWRVRISAARAILRSAGN